MILNSKNSHFVLNLPKGFIYENIEEKYDRFLSRLPKYYETVLDYLNLSAQSISFTGVTSENVEQLFNRRKQQWKGGFDFDYQIPREFSITFKLNEGFINYWILYEHFRQYLAFKQENKFLKDIRVAFLDRDGYELISFEFLQITMTSISEVTLDFSSNTPNSSTFSCDFTFNDFNIKHRID